MFASIGRSAGGIASRAGALGITVALAATLAACSKTATEGAAAPAADTITIGVLHSLSGTMSISEVAVKDATLLAVDEIREDFPPRLGLRVPADRE
jgi:urea transport system substrate-binding protein